MKWRTRRSALDGGQRVAFHADDGPVTFGAALTALRGDAPFRALVLERLRAAPGAAFFWETPPITRATLERPFEWVTLEAPALSGVRPDPEPFARHLSRDEPGEPVVAFANLAGDARLVAPREIGPADAYGHIAAFVRRALEDQAHALLARVAAEAEALVDDRLLWISTSGAGVAWLHVRLDRLPKYYQHRPYRVWAAPRARPYPDAP